MKKYIFILCCLLTVVNCYSQQCFSNVYLESFKKKHRNLEADIKSDIFSYYEKAEGENFETKSALPIITIPVIFNVLHFGEAEGIGRNLPLSKIKEQIDIMNMAYSGEYGGIDTRIRFCLATKDIAGQPITGVNRFRVFTDHDMGGDECGGINLEADSSIKVNFSPGTLPSTHLSIWTTNLKSCGEDSLLGYSTFPFFVEELGEANQYIDGVVLDYEFVGTNNSSGSIGLVAVHEVGHWLGLFHIFDGGCNVFSCLLEGDMICDTDNVPAPGDENIAPNECLGYKCGGGITTSVRNFMDYQTTERFYCQNTFTEDQTDRMRDNLRLHRSSFYNQVVTTDCSFDLSSGATCAHYRALETNVVMAPNMGYTYTSKSVFPRLEVDDDWLVTLTAGRNYGPVGSYIPPDPDFLHIYKRQGCMYTQHQNIELFNVFLDPDQYGSLTDYGLILNDDEIILSSYDNDAVYIYRYNKSTDSWALAQTITNSTTTSKVGTSTYLFGSFLFILGNESTSTSTFRVYYKNPSGVYVFHQNLVLTGMGLTLTKSCKMAAHNALPMIMNYNSPVFVGSYDADEILVGGKGGYATLYLKNDYTWASAGFSQPNNMPSNAYIVDIEVTKNFIYFLTTPGSSNSTINLYTYKTSANPNFYSVGYTMQTLNDWPNSVGSSIEITVIDDKFMFLDGLQTNVRYFENSVDIPQGYPLWGNPLPLGTSQPIICSNSGRKNDEIEIYGDLFFYGASILRMSDIIAGHNHDQTFIDNSDVINKKIKIMPEDFSTFANKITISETYPLSFNNVKKEFLAYDHITLKPGTTIANNSAVELRIVDEYEVCNNLLTSAGRMPGTDGEEVSNEVSEENAYTYDTLDKKITVIYPNPNKGTFDISTGKKYEGDINVEIYDMYGKIIYTNKYRGQTFTVSIPNLSSGVYIVCLTYNNTSETIKFIKE